MTVQALAQPGALADNRVHHDRLPQWRAFAMAQDAARRCAAAVAHGRHRLRRAARTTPPALAEVALADLPKEARDVYALVGRGGPFPYDRDGVVFGNREKLLPAQAARLLPRVHRAHARREEPRRPAPRLRRPADGPGRVLLHRRPLPIVPKDPPMKLPDLHDLEIAGVHAWHGDMPRARGGRSGAPSCVSSRPISRASTARRSCWRRWRRACGCPSISATTGMRSPIRSRMATGSARTAA